MPILREFIELDESVIYADNQKAYDALWILVRRLAAAKTLQKRVHKLAKHINEIEIFWAYVKLRFAKLKGLERIFYLYFKENSLDIMRKLVEKICIKSC